MSFNIENMQEFQNLLDQAAKKTSELIEVMERINNFEFEVVVNEDSKKADSEEAAKDELFIPLSKVPDKDIKASQLMKWVRESNNLTEKHELSRLAIKYLED